MGLKQLNKIFFIGIGGIGMSALARYFKSMNKKVSGYDKTETSLTNELESEGIEVMYSFDESSFPENIDLVIYTPAVIESDKKIYNFFKNSKLPMIKRSEALGIITEELFTVAVAGTHGKTTVTTMIAHILKDSGFDILAFMGGISANYNKNIIIPEKNEAALVVVEADEYDRSFLTLNPDIAVITSMDADHLDIYRNKETLEQNFVKFAGKLKQNGRIFINKKLNIGPISALYSMRETGVSLFTYSIDKKNLFTASPIHENIEDADFIATNINKTQNGYKFDFLGNQSIKDINLSVHGLHNIENATVAIAITQQLGVEAEKIKAALSEYKGVKRRFEYIIRKENLIFIDDYAHHPSEIRATINSIRDLYPEKSLTGIFQPHLYSRTRDFADEFAESLSLLDELILLDIYPARELPIPGIDSKYLLDKVKINNKVIYSKEELLDNIKNHKFDILLTIGAGDIDKLVLPLKNKLTEYIL
ncbi:MAG: UDP-N-acetylmuramate--L-alanine ligase [Bacteroidota bacterium]|nr:UDP-N-acetylmuramate--L-alanine ligase [Bacteroidota bacterium]